MTLTEEIAQLLHNLGLGVYKADGTAGGTIYLTRLPQTPDIAIAVARYAGPEADAKLPYDEPRIQIRTRGSKTDTRIGETKAQQIYDALHGMSSRTLPGGTWLLQVVAVQSGPVYMGVDGNGRDEWVVNVRTEIENSAYRA